MHPHYCCSSKVQEADFMFSSQHPRSMCWVQGRLLTEWGKFFWSLSMAPHHTPKTCPVSQQGADQTMNFQPRISNHEGSVLCLPGLGKRDLPNCSLRTATNNPATLSLKSEQPQAKRLDCLCRKQSSVSLHQPHETSFYQNSLKRVIMCSF